MKMKRLSFVLSILAGLSMLLAACQPAATQPAAPQPEATEPQATQPAAPEPSPVMEEFPREETLYTGGVQWGPPTGFNPWNLGNYAMGTFGLCYEPLFIYDPLADEYTPWLAESGEWTSDSVYEVTLRQGVTWSDGSPFTAADVKATFDIAKEAPVSISTVWKFLGSVETDGDYKVVFTFAKPAYQDWSYQLYSTPIVSKAKWEGKSVEEITSGLNPEPECTGPYTALSLDQTKVVWQKRDGWWATEALGLDPKPKYIVDIVNSGNNNVALGMVLQGQFDLNNNFLPGISKLVEGGYGIHTYYPAPPITSRRIQPGCS
jgi:peptide/nickel transport system substrate-binding protein